MQDRQDPLQCPLEVYKHVDPAQILARLGDLQRNKMTKNSDAPDLHFSPWSNLREKCKFKGIRFKRTPSAI